MRFFKKIAVVILIVLTIGSSMDVKAASYDGEDAADYAEMYALTYYGGAPVFLGLDCTNFISQCVNYGGIPQKGHYLSAPSLFSKWKLDTNSNYWYAKKYDRSIGYDYWQYSKTWSTVTGFEDYMTLHVPNVIKKEYGLSAYSLNALTKSLKLGDVLQLDGSHSIIISKINSTGVYYSCHSSNIKNRNIKYFYDWCAANGKKINYFKFIF